MAGRSDILGLAAFRGTVRKTMNGSGPQDSCLGTRQRVRRERACPPAGDGVGGRERPRGVGRVDLYSVMCVSDRVRALEWFGVFFGRSADEVIGGEHLWQVGEN